MPGVLISATPTRWLCNVGRGRRAEHLVVKLEHGHPEGRGCCASVRNQYPPEHVRDLEADRAQDVSAREFREAFAELERGRARGKIVLTI